MGFGQHLRQLREDAGLSRAELARRAGVPASTLRGWEGDRGFPGPIRPPAAGRGAGVPVERLAEGVGDPAEEESGAMLGGACGRRPKVKRLSRGSKSRR